MKKYLNTKGMTLVELLAVLVIGSIVILLAFNVLFSLFFKHNEKIVTAANVRDTADYYLESLANYIYSLKESEIEKVVESETDGYYIVEKSSPDDKTGFVNEEGTIYLYIGGDKKESPYPGIQISKLHPTDSDKTPADSKKTWMIRDKNKKNVYKITLTLEYNNDQSKTFKKEVHSLP
ncbi:MAG: prepilin-type N-terminal cleavage/methylation domain-containing protein [Lysinibacillus sp.]|nr:prepilin-type N-terminal cleavage/methylation domain-containing protein [Lysinibacillus sp.]